MRVRVRGRVQAVCAVLLVFLALAVSSRVRAAPLDAVSRTSSRFVSFTIDASELFGTSWFTARFPFSDPRVRAAAAALSPAYVRVGGTDADRVCVNVSTSQPPVGCDRARSDVLYLSSVVFDELVEFAANTSLGIVWGVSGGPVVRNGTTNAWIPDNFEQLQAHIAATNASVAAFELTNEPNLFATTFGVEHIVTGAQLARDIASLRASMSKSPATARALLVAPDVALQVPLVTDFLLSETLTALNDKRGDVLDVVSWHFYPFLGERVLKAPLNRWLPTVGKMHDVRELSTVRSRAATVRKSRDALAPNAELWLGETGGSSGGGQAGITDTFVDGYYWMYTLGFAALSGHRVVARQCLWGASYGLLDSSTGLPNPDFWLSLLWKRAMGTVVLEPPASTAASVELFAHCAAAPGDASDGAVTFALMNVDSTNAADVSLPVGDDGRWLVYEITPGDNGSLTSKTALLNGVALAFAPDGSLPDLSPRPVLPSDAKGGSATFTMPPASMAFVVARLNTDACFPTIRAARLRVQSRG